MALRSGHGKGGSTPHIEVRPADELLAGVPGPARRDALRDETGKFLPGAATKELARTGGLAAGQSKQLAQLLGLWTPPEEHAYAPYARLAREWRDQHMAQLAGTVGGGEVGSGPASIISSAALQMAASRWLYDEGAKNGDARMMLDASRLANDSRQNLLAAHEICAREATARRDAAPTAGAPWLVGKESK